MRRGLLPAALMAIFCLLVGVGCSASAEEVAGSWEGSMELENGEPYDLTLDLHPSEGGSSLSGEGMLTPGEGASGSQIPVVVSGGEVSGGGQVSLNLEDSFGGNSLQVSVDGDLSGDRMSGNGTFSGVNTTGTNVLDATFELTKQEGE